MFPYRPGLDVVRFLAAIWVMLHHARAVRGGSHAVALFFVLSGYLIGGQLVSEKRSRGTIRLPEFYFKRVSRIWVPYFIVVFGYIALFFARGQNKVAGFYERTFSALTYTYNILNDIRGSVHTTWHSANQIWSLSIEEQFYLVVPLLIVLLPVSAIGPVSLALTVVLMLGLPLYAGLALGVFMATCLTRYQSTVVSLRSSFWFGIALFAGFAALVAIGHTNISASTWTTYALSACVVFFATYVTVPQRFHGTLRYLGLMTYSYYLIHTLPEYFLGAAIRRILSISEVPIWTRVVLGFLALPISYYFVRWIELPTLRARAKVLKAGSPIVQYAPWLAWGLSLVGVGGLIVFSRR